MNKKNFEIIVSQKWPLLSKVFLKLDFDEVFMICTYAPESRKKQNWTIPLAVLKVLYSKGSFH